MNPLPPVRRTRVTPQRYSAAVSRRSGIAQERPPGRAMRILRSCRPTRSRPDDPVPVATPGGTPPPNPPKEEIRSVLTTRSLVPRPPRRVLIAWIVLLFVGFAVSGAVGGAFRDEFARHVESKTGFDILDEQFGGQGTGITGTIVFQADQGVDDPAVREAMQALFDEVAEHRRRRAGREPLRRGRRRSRSRREGADAGQDRLRQRRDARRHRASRGPARSATRSATNVPEIDGLRDRARRVHLRRVRGAVVRGPRPRLRHRHPDRRVRLGAGHGPARRRRAVRHRHRHRDHHAAQQRARRSPTSPRSSAS